MWIFDMNVEVKLSRETKGVMVWEIKGREALKETVSCVQWIYRMKHLEVDNKYSCFKNKKDSAFT